MLPFIYYTMKSPSTRCCGIYDECVIFAASFCAILIFCYHNPCEFRPNRWVIGKLYVVLYLLYNEFPFYTMYTSNNHNISLAKICIVWCYCKAYIHSITTMFGEIEEWDYVPHSHLMHPQLPTLFYLWLLHKIVLTKLC